MQEIDTLRKKVLFWRFARSCFILQKIVKKEKKSFRFSTYLDCYLSISFITCIIIYNVIYLMKILFKMLVFHNNANITSNIDADTYSSNILNCLVKSNYDFSIVLLSTFWHRINEMRTFFLSPFAIFSKMEQKRARTFSLKLSLPKF